MPSPLYTPVCLTGSIFSRLKGTKLGLIDYSVLPNNNVSVCQRTTVQGLKFELSSIIYNLLNGETMVLNVNRKFDLHQYKPVLNGWASLLLEDWDEITHKKQFYHFNRVKRKIFGENVWIC